MLIFANCELIQLMKILHRPTLLRKQLEKLKKFGKMKVSKNLLI
jgi:hypothetical protein